ncbi:MAG: GNAT family N-acetyltransferase [Lachnospiraceae bacterium]|nr:GNAT family N-acetyltransferase [Lachnospiraceae bacterium]
MCKELIQATKKDYESILEAYDQIIEGTPDMDKFARWKKGLHPNEESIQEYIEQGAMYLLKCEEKIAGTMAVTMSQGEDYQEIEWKIVASDEEVSVIHLLGVNPAFQKKGIGGKLVDAAIQLARENHKKAVRLDALDSNAPAKQMYLQKGFVFCGKKKLYADNTGWIDFCFFEKECING